MTQSDDDRRTRQNANYHEAARGQLYGLVLLGLDHLFSADWRGEVELNGLSLRPPRGDSNEFLVVLRGIDHEGGPMVAFHSSVTAIEALAGAIERMQSGTLKWKPDAYRS